MHRTVGWLMAVLMATLLVACGGGDGGEDDEIAVEVEATEGFVVLGASRDGVLKVEAPLGSSAIGVEVTVEKIEDGRAAADPLFEGLVGGIVEYELGPDGQEFDEPVLVSITSSAAELGLDANQVPLPLLGVSHADGAFEPLETTVERVGDELIVSAELGRFSKIGWLSSGLYLEFAVQGKLFPSGPVSVPAGGTLTISGAVLACDEDLGTEFLYSCKATGSRPSGQSDRSFQLELHNREVIGRSQEGLLNRNMTVVYECGPASPSSVRESFLVDLLYLEANSRSTVARIEVTCEGEGTVEETAGEDGPGEIAFGQFEPDDLKVLDDGTIAILSAPFDGKITYVRPDGNVKEISLAAPATSHDCETDLNSPDYDFGCDWFVWPIAHDAEDSCYWVSYPDGTIECIGADGKAVAGSTIDGKQLCGDTGRTEKADAGGQNCLPSQPNPTETGKPSFITTTFGTLLKEENGEYVECHTLAEGFDSDDVTYYSAADAAAASAAVETADEAVEVAADALAAAPGDAEAIEDFDVAAAAARNAAAIAAETVAGTLTIRTVNEVSVLTTRISWPACDVVTADVTEDSPFYITWGFKREIADPDAFYSDFNGNPYVVTVDNDEGVDNDQDKVFLYFPRGPLVELEPDRRLAYPPTVAFDERGSFVFLPEATGTNGVLLWQREIVVGEEVQTETGQIEIAGEVTNMVITEDSLYASVILRDDRGGEVAKLLRYKFDELPEYE